MVRQTSPYLSCMFFKIVSARAHRNSHCQSGKALNKITQCILYRELNRYANVSQASLLNCNLDNSMKSHTSIKHDQTDTNKAYDSELTSPTALP